ncbi:MAG: tRNA (adenosine(37)-N6)-dimethylallyltransferase MiaA [Ginsengibacter sp.]
MNSKKTCIIVSGATASGKTAYALELAHQHKTQIISADSRQCYKELNIGVAKPSIAQLHAVHHYFINSHSITDDVNVKVFERYALEAVYKVFETNDVAVMAGGTGLYIKAFCEGIDEIPATDEKLRATINKSYKIGGIDWLIDEIKKVDSKYFVSGEIQNPQRMMRALEVKLSTGKSILDFHSGQNVQRDFEIKKINLEVPREELYERINNRVNKMMEAGLLNEAENLFPHRDLNALQTVGYRELFNFMEGKISLPQAVEEIKKNTRHFAKRQVTWFKKYNS